MLYGVGKHINDLLEENDPAGQKSNARASAALLDLKNALYSDTIEPAAPGFRDALATYQQASVPIDEQMALQKFEPKLYDANNQMTYAKVQSMMRQIVDSRQAPGPNQFKSISDATMAKLWDLRDDLRRTAAAGNLERTPGGSDTAQNTADAARLTAKSLGGAVLRMIPGVGPAINRGQATIQPALDARAARERSTRGMAILRPDVAPVERPDQPSLDPAPLAAPMTQVQREQAALAIMKARSAPQGGANSTLASRNVNLYNPLDRPQRDFAADYPQGAPVDASGRITHDIEGRPLTAGRVVGRTLVGQDDASLPPEALDPLATDVTGNPISPATSRTLPRGAVGVYRHGYDPATGEPVRGVFVSNSISPSTKQMVASHEIGHALDEIAGQIPTAGLNQELRQVYSALNTGQERTRNLTVPRHLGYTDAEAPRELMAEAIRGYMANPNWLKTVAPKTLPVNDVRTSRGVFVGDSMPTGHLGKALTTAHLNQALSGGTKPSSPPSPPSQTPPSDKGGKSDS